MELLCFSFILNNNDWFVIRSSLDLEWPKLNVLLYNWVIKLSSDKSLGIEDSVNGVFGSLVLGCISDKSFGIGEGNI